MNEMEGRSGNYNSYALLFSIGLILTAFLAGDYKFVGYIGVAIILFLQTRRLKNGVIKSEKGLLQSVILLVLFMLIHLIVSIMIGNYYQHTLYNAIEQVAIYVYILFIVSSEYDKETIKKICKYYTFFFVIIILVLLASGGLNQIVYSKPFHTQLGMFSIPVLACVYLYEDRKLVKAIATVLAILLSYYAEARSAILGIIVFIIARFIYKKMSKNRKRGKTLFVIAIVTCLIIPIAYLGLNDNIFGLRDGVNKISIELTGSRFFSGRDILWPIVIDKIGEQPLFGSGIGISLSDFSDENVSTHNLFLFVILQTGFVGLLLFLYLLYNMYRNMQMRERDDTCEYIALMIGLLVQQSFSLGLLSGKMGFAFICWTILAFGASKIKEGKPLKISDGED